MATIKKISIALALERISRVNSKLFELLAPICTAHDFPELFREVWFASFVMGEEIVKSGRLVEIEDLSESDYRLLTRNNIPIGILINSRSEIYSYFDSRTVYHAILKKGGLFGVFEFLDSIMNYKNQENDPRLQFNMSAGYKHFLTPFASDTFKDCVKFCKLSKSRKTTDPLHLSIAEEVRSIAQDGLKLCKEVYARFESEKIMGNGENEDRFSLELTLPQTEVILFSDEFINHCRMKSTSFSTYILELGWKQSSLLRYADLKSITNLVEIKKAFATANQGDMKFERLDKETHKNKEYWAERLDLYHATILTNFFEITQGLRPCFCWSEIHDDDDPVSMTQKVLRTVSEGGVGTNKNQFRLFYLDYLSPMNRVGFSTIHNDHTAIHRSYTDENFNEFYFALQALKLSKTNPLANLVNVYSSSNPVQTSKTDFFNKHKILFANNDKGKLVQSEFAGICYYKSFQFPVLPVLEHLKTIFTDFKFEWGKTFLIGVQHLMESTGSLIECLIAEGLHSDKVYLLGKIYSTHYHTLEKLKQIGVNARNSREPERLGDYSQSFEADVKLMWSQLLMRVKKGDRVVILDDGAYTIKNAPVSELRRNDISIVAIEQTTSGIKNLFDSLSMPVINVAASEVKTKIEPFIVTDAIIAKCGDIVMQNSSARIGVIGLGNIGNNLVSYLNGQKIKTGVFDKSKVKMEKYRSRDHVIIYKNINELFQSTDIIIGCSGEDISSKVWLDICDSDKQLLSFTSGDTEFNTLLKLANGRTEYNSVLDTLVIKTKKHHSITVHRGGFVANFTGDRESAPDNLIQLTRGLLFGAVMQGLTRQYSIPRIEDLEPNIQKACFDHWIKYNSEYRKTSDLLAL